MAPIFSLTTFQKSFSYLSTLLKFCLLSLKKMEGKGREGKGGRRNRIARRINVVPGGEYSPIYLCGEGDIREKNV